MGKELIYSYINDIALRLKDSRKYGHTSVMVGAGFSKNADNLSSKSEKAPDWNELAEKMYLELHPLDTKAANEEKNNWEKQKIIKTSGKNVTKLAEEYIVNFDRNKMNKLIEDSINDSNYAPGDLHKKLLSLEWHDVFTTNYDTLLERASKLIIKENSFRIVYSQSDLPGSIHPRIIKLHGSIPHVKPYIICDEDYRTYPTQYSTLVNTVQQSMIETRLCLIGFSGDDPNFQSWLGWLRDNMGEHCPKIYLIGVFNRLSEPERRLLEKNQISVVDISILVEEKVENIHYESMHKFLDLLSEIQIEEDIYIKRPYKNQHSFEKLENPENYLKELTQYSIEVWNWMEPFILIPEKKRANYAKYFDEQFIIVLNNSFHEGTYDVVYYLIKIMRKCLRVLHDSEAEKLNRIYDTIISFTGLKYSLLRYEIDMYLLEMYRIDYDMKLYNQVLTRVDNYSPSIKYSKNEILIEKAKIAITNFDIAEAKKTIIQISETSFEYKLKKSGLYKQIQERELAGKLISSCLSELAQMQISDDLYTSYIGYLNLCYRVDNFIIDSNSQYSDVNYYDNEFNIRNIIVTLRENLHKEFNEVDRDKDKPLPFELNTQNTTTSLTINDSTFEDAFSFLLGIDTLCLPLFSDQVKLLPRALRAIINSSPNMYWKLSLVTRSYDKDTTEHFFTREMLQSFNESERLHLYNTLIELSKLFQLSDPYNYKSHIISIKTLLDVLSRLSVYVNESDFIVFMNVLCKFSNHNDHIIQNDINKIIQRVKTRFNGQIASKLVDTIFIDFSYNYHLASYFNNYSIKIKKEKVNKLYSISLNNCKSDDIAIRDCGISQLMILWNNYQDEKQYKKISDILWGNSEDEFPKTSLYYNYVWETLPHPKNINFSDLYYNYLFKDRFDRSVITNGIQYGSSYNSVVNYVNFYYFTSQISKRKCAKVIYDTELGQFILKTIYDFSKKEKTLLERDYDPFGGREINKFDSLVELTTFVYSSALINDFSNDIYDQVIEIRDFFKGYEISVKSIDMLVEINNNDYLHSFEIFENAILSKIKKDGESVFTGMQCIIRYLEVKKNKDKNIKKYFGSFINSIKYFDIEYVKWIWIQIPRLICNSYFSNLDIQKNIADTINDCINIYKEHALIGNRFYFDGLYNCIYALCNYYDTVDKSKSNISDNLKKCFKNAKSIDNYEIENIWKNQFNLV